MLTKFSSFLTSIPENAWAFAIIFLGAVCAIASIRHHELLAVGQAISAGGMVAFRGGKANSQ